MLAGELPAADRAADVEFFENRIRPILIEHCFECHSASAPKIKGGLRLDSREAIRNGGDSGPAVVPGRVDESLLIDALRHESLEMPPGKKLPPEVIADFVKWVELGSPDPREAPPSAEDAAELSWRLIFAKRRSWWSLLPLQQVSPADPGDDGWSSQPVDRLVLAKLHSAGLQPAGTAEPEVLLRRLCFVITGLPPTADLATRFNTQFAEAPQQAVSDLADELLASPHFGERMARHWMDVVRYGDTYGYEWDPPAKGAWRYRDYLIRAFNEDVGFDQLVREQIAGDLLPDQRINAAEQLNESLAGPMFFHMGEHRHGSSLQFNGIHQDMVNNKIDAFSKAFLATTVACARCHDHKLDAVSQRDYYALASVITTPRWGSRLLDTPARNHDAIAALQQLRFEIRRQLARSWSEQACEFGNELDVAMSHGSIAESASHQGLRLVAWQSAFREADSKVTPTLEDAGMIGPLLRSKFYDDELVSSAWSDLATTWNRAHTAHTDFNARNFELLADFRTPGVPAGWAFEGDGILHGYVDDGTPLVALEGRSVVQRVLPRGYHTNSLSPRLPGALRSPRLQSIEKPLVSLKIAGGQWAAHHLVPANAILSGSQDFLENIVPTWKLYTTHHNVKPAEWTVWSEWTTAALNSNFPGPTYLTKKMGLAPDADNDVLNGWFSLTGIVTHERAETPKDALYHWQGLLSRAEPTRLADAWRMIGEWLAQAVDRWCREETVEGDVVLINWLLDRGLLVNEAAPSTRLGDLVARYREIERTIALPRTVNSMDERGMTAVPYPLEVRGNVDDPGEPVAHGFLEVFAGQNDVAKSPGSGRLELAEFLVSPKNPLTARVYVNRVWQWVFGTGLVSTPDDFGHLGDKPSHPELLDWLASDFMAHGWSTKWLVRQLVLSSTFRQSGNVTEAGRLVDPDNRLLHHYSTRRLEAESIRDAILAVSGRLDPQLYGPPIDPPRHSEDATKRLFTGPLDGSGRRSFYTKITLMEPPKFLSSFNFPDPKIPTGKRDVTNVPTQALALLNSPFVMAQAEFWSARLIQEHQHSPEERIRQMFVRALSREPAVDELICWCQVVEELRFRQGVSSSHLMTATDIWTQIAHALFNTKEFIYYR